MGHRQGGAETKAQDNLPGLERPERSRQTDDRVRGAGAWRRHSVFSISEAAFNARGAGHISCSPRDAEGIANARSIRSIRGHGAGRRNVRLRMRVDEPSAWLWNYARDHPNREALSQCRTRAGREMAAKTWRRRLRDRNRLARPQRGNGCPAIRRAA